ncbi:OmpA family protein [Candidatus Poribacteria bacterium]|jgi:flagellar motor protein MotB|nr:OmpA family protein [Candidatus Poribacteria bacterium]MBT7808223.1 OmpA family protein [Candidatus Poribacteria bacterium]
MNASLTMLAQTTTVKRRIGAGAAAVALSFALATGCGSSIAAIDLQSAVDDANAAVQASGAEAGGRDEHALAQRLLEESVRQQDGGDAWASYYLAVRAAYTADVARVSARDERARRRLDRLRQDTLEAKLRAAQAGSEASITRRLIAETLQARAEADAAAARQDAEKARGRATQTDADAQLSVEKALAEAELSKAQFLMDLATEAEAGTHDADGYARAQGLIDATDGLLAEGSNRAARLKAIEAYRAASDTRQAALNKQGAQRSQSTEARFGRAVDAAMQIGRAAAEVDRARDADAVRHAPAEFGAATDALTRAEAAHAAGSYPEAARLATAAGEAAHRAIVAGEGAKTRDMATRRREEQEAMVKDAVLRVRRAADTLDTLTRRLSPGDLATAGSYADLAESALADSNLDLAVANADRAHGLMDAVERKGADSKEAEAGLVSKAKSLPDTQAFTTSKGVVLRVTGDLFAVGKTELKKSAYPSVAKLAAALLPAAGSYDVVVEGHTDKSGDADTNVRLSKERAGAFAKLLAEYLGAAGSNVTSTGYGAKQLIAGVAPTDASNRRIEIVVLTRKAS